MFSGLEINLNLTFWGKFNNDNFNFHPKILTK